MQADVEHFMAALRVQTEVQHLLEIVAADAPKASGSFTPVAASERISTAPVHGHEGPMAVPSTTNGQTGNLTLSNKTLKPPA